MIIIKPLFITASLLLSQASFASDDKHDAGEKLFKANCAVCHGVAGGMDMSKRIAPPIAAVRLHYIDSYPDEASFVQAVTSWVAKQDESKSLMRGAIQKFKIMPPLVVAKEDAEKIAAYIYSGDIEKPVGFEQHVAEEHGKMGMGKGLHGQGKGMHQMQGKGKQGQGMGMHQMQGKGMQGQHQGMNKMRQAMQGRGMMGKMRRGGKRGMSAKMMQQLNLSPQQQQQMQAFIQEKESRIRPLKMELRQISQTIRQLDTTSPNYKSQIFSLADEKAKRVQRLVIEKGEMRMKIESVLNPEQRAKFKQLRQQRRQKMLQH